VAPVLWQKIKDLPFWTYSRDISPHHVGQFWHCMKIIFTSHT